MPKSDKNILAFMAPVEIMAAKDGESGPARFSMTAYTGGELELRNFELPVIVDLAGAKFHKSVKANLNHKREQMVGHVDQQAIVDGKSIQMAGAISGGGDAANEVLTAHKKGYPWEASIQANRLKLETLARGEKEIVNGQEFTGPKYIARESTIYAVAFCDQGADDSTEVTIAAKAAPSKGKAMKAEIKAWAEGMGVDIANATPEAIATIEANYEGRNGTKAKGEKPSPSTPFEKRKIEAQRQTEIRELADRFMGDDESDMERISSIEAMCDHAIKEKMSPQDFRSELIMAMVPMGQTVRAPKRDNRLNDRIIEAAICQSLRLCSDKELVETHRFTDQELQAAHSQFRSRIGLKQILHIAAESNGFRGNNYDWNKDVLAAAFGTRGDGRQIYAAGGMSTISISNILAATVNKFLFRGWMTVDMTPMRIAKIRSVSDFKTVTTVSLTGDLQYLKVGQDGEIKHGTVSDQTYTNSVDTYARMLAITRKDIINDDLGALDDVPSRLGRGAALKLNDIFWTEFLGLVGASFFASGNSNINTGVADMTVGGLDATETIFMNQTDPDSKPLAIQPTILLVPSALKNKAITLMTSELAAAGATTFATAPGAGNPFRGRFTVESSPYISNSSYTGNTAVGWWMLADPNVLPTIEIAALNGRVEPTVETADADFNLLGVQMRGYSDVGVHRQEYRGGVYADGGSS